MVPPLESVATRLRSGGSLRDELLRILDSEKDDDGLALALRAIVRALPRRLTPRQREVGELLLEGCTTAQMAQRLSAAGTKVEPRTVKAHLAALYRRYNIGSCGQNGKRGNGTGRVALALLLCRRQAKGEPW